jgi:hypothetical protein
VKSGKYPPFLQNAKGRTKATQNTVSASIANKLRSKDADERIPQLAAIIEYCKKGLRKTKAEIDSSR